MITGGAWLRRAQFQNVDGSLRYREGEARAMPKSIKYALSGKQCFCMSCGRKFGSVSGFERHRKGFRCVDPGIVGMHLNEKGYWKQPKQAYLLMWLIKNQRSGSQAYLNLNEHLLAGEP